MPFYLKIFSNGDQCLYIQVRFLKNGKPIPLQVFDHLIERKLFKILFQSWFIKVDLVNDSFSFSYSLVL